MKKLIARKAKQYGKPLDNFSCIDDFRTTFKNYYDSNPNKVDNTSQESFMIDESLHGVFRKLARIANGINSAEHWRDIAGYATIMTSYLEDK